jgi:alkanesulfonate monooxygenase SsuD/methylene tetrahydromethanopterin reductase-like flavin-dependent oxidoreductase (luciferase family)
LKLMRALWTEETATFKGQYYELENGRIEPKPLTKPHPPVWIGGWGKLTLKRAATLGENWIPGPTADLARLQDGKQQFSVHRSAAGLTAPTEWPLTRDVIIADTDREARELAEHHIMISYRHEYAGGWRHPFIDATIATDLDGLMRDRFLIGGPDQVIAGIKRFVEVYGMTHLICRLFFPGMPHAHITHELDLLAHEVMPVFR